MKHGLGEPATACQTDAEVVMGLGIVGLDVQNLLEMANGLVDLSTLG